jgi:hypothetical protein
MTVKQLLVTSVCRRKQEKGHGGIKQRAGLEFCQVKRCKNRPDDGGSKHLCNIGKLILGYTAQHPRT